jgi:hypothetical protein
MRPPRPYEKGPPSDYCSFLSPISNEAAEGERVKKKIQKSDANDLSLMRPPTDETVNGVAVNRQSVLFTKDLEDASIGSRRPCGAQGSYLGFVSNEF